SSSVTLDGTTTAQLPDQSGQNLAWSLQPINGYDRESVAVTVSLPSPTPLQLDSGAHAYATLDAGAVSATTPAATLRAGNVSDPSLLASTPDANTTDPYVQEEAAALDYDPTQIFNFLHTQIGYNSYLGSVRGARGTLWSNAGNALDVASLGVALMRASGIPAQ
ncbi:MAG TPA: transglutaminase family protein, partial [Isosphaeraceae bacterium]|nr:transglutaminase family protein [Isosphaeraceae bacterium]